MSLNAEHVQIEPIDNLVDQAKQAATSAFIAAFQAYTKAMGCENATLVVALHNREKEEVGLLQVEDYENILGGQLLTVDSEQHHEEIFNRLSLVQGCNIVPYTDRGVTDIIPCSEAVEVELNFSITSQSITNRCMFVEPEESEE